MEKSKIQVAIEALENIAKAARDRRKPGHERCQDVCNLVAEAMDTLRAESLMPESSCEWTHGVSSEGPTTCPDCGWPYNGHGVSVPKEAY